MKRGRQHRHKHSRQMGEFRGNGRQRSGGPASDPIYNKQMKDVSNGRQRFVERSSDVLPPKK